MSDIALEPKDNGQAACCSNAIAQETFLSSQKLEWNSCLEQLFVIHQTGSIVLFTCHFQENGISINSGENDNVYGSAIGMMDQLLGEILASNGHIKEITHEKEILSFAYGEYCCFILFTNNHANEIKYRLEKFAIDFEKQFAAKLARNFNINMNEYQKAISLVERHIMM